MSAETPISHKEMAKLGWTRTDPRPWGKLQAVWEHRDGWRLRHCGHPTANQPWALYDPKGAFIRTGVLYAKPPDPTKGTAWRNLRAAAEYVASLHASERRRA
jgi:hypothetical protein